MMPTPTPTPAQLSPDDLANLGIFGFIVAAVFAVTWLIFPFLVCVKLNRIARINRDMLDELQRMGTTRIKM